MIKKIKQVCLKNKVNNQNEFIKEEERKIDLDEKKYKLRSEIFKQIEFDIKEKERLENELKTEEINKINLIKKQAAEDSIVNRFYEKGYLDFDSDN
jgi:hypothetical protein